MKKGGLVLLVLLGLAPIGFAAGPIECFSTALPILARVSFFSDPTHTAQELCTGTSSSSAPIECYKAAVDWFNSIHLTYVEDRAVGLCSGTSSASAPLDCYKVAMPTFVSDGWVDSIMGAADLCGGAVSSAGPLQCYEAAVPVLKQVHGVSDPMQTAAELCKGQ